MVEVICFVLLMFWFYEGIYKVANWAGFSFYMKHAPLLRTAWQVPAYAIPIGEISLAVLLLVPKYRSIALYTTIGALLLFVFWIMSVYLFTGYLFWPYHALWDNPTWMQKILSSLVMCWLSYIAVVIYQPIFRIRDISSSE